MVVKIIKKIDLIVIFIMLAAAAVSYVLVLRMQSGGSAAIVKFNNEIVRVMPLNRDAVYIVEQDSVHARIEVKNGRVCMAESSCPDKLCVKQGNYSRLIVCLPNKIVIEVQNEDDYLDAVSG